MIEQINLFHKYKMIIFGTGENKEYRDRIKYKIAIFSVLEQNIV